MHNIIIIICDVNSSVTGGKGVSEKFNLVQRDSNASSGVIKIRKSAQFCTQIMFF